MVRRDTFCELPEKTLDSKTNPTAPLPLIGMVMGIVATNLGSLVLKGVFSGLSLRAFGRIFRNGLTPKPSQIHCLLVEIFWCPMTVHSAL